MAKGYWRTVPKGIWRVSDATDALNAIQDSESFLEFDKVNFRVHVLGEKHKAVIIDLETVFKELQDSPREKATFVDTLKRLLKLETL